MIQINRVAVLGAGVMGATIAAHLANSGLEVLMLDIVPKDLTEAESNKGLTLNDNAVRNRIAVEAVKGLSTMKPSPLYLPGLIDRIEVGNFDDDLEKCADCDWIIEVVVEYLPIKIELLKKITPFLKENTVLTTNTSGLSVNEMAEALPEFIRTRFLATHFFNPPRYMRLMEVVPCKETDPEILSDMTDFLSDRLGKGIVYAKDTPNFIANRIGVYAIYKSIQHMLEMDLTVEEVDTVAGPATARPKSAAFRTADLVGLDTLAHVGTNSYEQLPDDEERQVFRLPDFMKAMIENEQLGNKSGRGFYLKQKKDGKSHISYYDYQAQEYKPLTKRKFGSVESVKLIDDPGERIKALIDGGDKGAEFGWRSLRDVLLYAFNRIPEIAENIVNIDNGMRWGFNWELGPFEIFDAIGVKAFVQRAEHDGITIPEKLKGIDSFYRFNDEGLKEYYDLVAEKYVPIEVKAAEVQLDILKRADNLVEKTSSCSLVDMGEGVFCLEFHSKMNAISGDILAMTPKAVNRAEREGIGLVIGNRGTNFSVGANLMLLAVAIAEGAFEDIDLVIRSFQRATMALKYARVPVVAAPFNMTLGGGCEYCLHADSITAHAETYMGLVEIGVGLLPAGGGTKEMSLRAVECAEQFKTDVQPFILKYFEQIALAKVSTSAAELRHLGYMRPGDSISINVQRQLGDAKKRVLALATNYLPRFPRNDIPAPGRDIAASIRSQLWNMKMGSFITEYEAELGGIIADTICGGDVNPGTLISEHYLLDLERKNFLKLCSKKNTALRIQHMLKTGKPLRN